MTKIYDQHDQAFRFISAFAILKDGNHVANVSIKFPKDGAGRLWAYVHFLGLEMARDFAGGYGYDKRTPAVKRAAEKIPPYLADDLSQKWQIERAEDINKKLSDFKAAFENVGGKYWADALRDAGFTVCNVV